MAKRPYLETVRYRQTLDELACEETLKPSKETLNVSREHRDTVKRSLHVFGFSTEYLEMSSFEGGDKIEFQGQMLQRVR